MKNLIKVVSILIFCLLIINCCTSSTEPSDNYKNPNDMTWTCDTLFYSNVGQTSLNHILAFSASDIYAYGWSSGNTILWHFNGSKWSMINILEKIGAFDINKMIGFSNSNIFCFGDAGLYTSKIVRLYGLDWTEYTSAGIVPARLLTACADRSTNIYTAGDNGWIQYYNGSAWQKDQIKMKINSGDQYFIRGSAIYKDTTCFLAYLTSNIGRQVYYFIKGKYKNWNIMDSMVINNANSQFKWGNWDLQVTPDNKLISFGDTGVYEYTGAGWTHILATENCVNGIFSLNNNYTLAVGALNEVYFQDEAGWIKLTKFNNDSENIIYKDVWGNGKELFIMGNTTGSFPQKTIIWHGK